MRVVPNPGRGGGFNVVGKNGKVLVRGLTNEQSGFKWIEENGADWPPNWSKYRK